MTELEINRFILDAIESEMAFDYDEIVSVLESERGEVFDVFVRLAYHISIIPLSPRQGKRAAIKMANLAVHTLQFNMIEGCTGQIDETLEAVAEAYQKVR